MRKSNFDQSSTGLNLEFAGFYDTCLARDDFECEFEHLAEIYRDVSAYLFGAETDKLWESLTITGKRKELLRFMREEIPGWERPQNAKTSVLIQEIIGEFSKEDILKMVLRNSGQICFSRLFSDSIAYDLYFDFAGFDWSNVRGYSQGDSVYVFYPIDNNPGYDTLVNYCFDSPVYACLEIDGEEHFLDEDRYDWDKDKVLARLSESLEHPRKDEILAWCEENLPEHLD